MSPPPPGSLGGTSLSIPAFGIRQAKVATAMLDFTVVVLGVLAAYLARFEGLVPPDLFHQMLVLLPLIGLYRVLSIASSSFGPEAPATLAVSDSVRSRSQIGNRSLRENRAKVPR